MDIRQLLNPVGADASSAYYYQPGLGHETIIIDDDEPYPEMTKGRHKSSSKKSDKKKHSSSSSSHSKSSSSSHSKSSSSSSKSSKSYKTNTTYPSSTSSSSSRSYICILCGHPCPTEINLIQHVEGVHVGTECHWPGCGFSSAGYSYDESQPHSSSSPTDPESLMKAHLRTAHSNGGERIGPLQFVCPWPECEEVHTRGSVVNRCVRKHNTRSMLERLLLVEDRQWGEEEQEWRAFMRVVLMGGSSRLRAGG